MIFQRFSQLSLNKIKLPKQIVSIVFFVFNSFVLDAQFIERHVVSSGTSYTRLSNLEVEWTIGEPVIAKTPVIGNHITQGFYQKVCVNPTIQFLPQVTQFCWHATPIILDFAQPSGGTWYGSGIILQNQQPYFAPAYATVGSNVLYYRYTDLQGCTGLDSLTLEVNACTELESEVSKYTIRLFPVPADQYLEVSGYELSNSVEVTTLSGQVFTLPVTDYHVPTISLPNGVYYIRLSSVVLPFTVLHP